MGFAVGLEDFRDFAICSFFDELVCVYELVAQCFGQAASYGRFSCAHESDEG